MGRPISSIGGTRCTRSSLKVRPSAPRSAGCDRASRRIHGIELAPPAPWDFWSSDMSAILLSVHRLKNNEIYDRQGNKLGTIADVMIDGHLMHAQYVVMSFNGPLTAAKKQFAVPI